MENLQNVVIRKYKCDVCEYTSDRKRNVRRHWNKMHGDAKHQASPIVKAPMPLHQLVSCREVQTQIGSDDSIADSESDTSSVVSDIDINLKSLQLTGCWRGIGAFTIGLA